MKFNSRLSPISWFSIEGFSAAIALDGLVLVVLNCTSVPGIGIESNFPLAYV